MHARKLPRRVDVGMTTVSLAIPLGLSALTLTTGFSPVYALVVGAATASVCWWTLRADS
jgi:Kef-type K+ transport system membrane component KefB